MRRATSVGIFIMNVVLPPVVEEGEVVEEGG